MSRLVLDHWVASAERTPATGVPSIELTAPALSGPGLTHVALWSHASRPWCSPTSFTVAAAPGDCPGAGSWPSWSLDEPARVAATTPPATPTTATAAIAATTVREGGRRRCM